MSDRPIIFSGPSVRRSGLDIQCGNNDEPGGEAFPLDPVGRKVAEEREIFRDDIGLALSRVRSAKAVEHVRSQVHAHAGALCRHLKEIVGKYHGRWNARTVARVSIIGVPS